MGQLYAINFEDESITQYGAAKIEDLEWKLVQDAYACIMCNRCQDACPANATGKALSPSALEVNKRYFLNDHNAALAAGQPSPAGLLDFAIRARGSLGLHHLRRVRGDLPGRQRAHARHPRHPPQPGADGEQVPRPVPGRLPRHGAPGQSLERRPREPAGVGGRP